MKAVLTIVFSAALAGCAFVPKANPRLEEARIALRDAEVDPRIAELAPAELRAAREAFARALAASSMLDDPAVVDHLAYLARQRAVISRETARLGAVELRTAAPAAIARR